MGLLAGSGSGVEHVVAVGHERIKGSLAHETTAISIARRRPGSIPELFFFFF